VGLGVRVRGKVGIEVLLEVLWRRGPRPQAAIEMILEWWR
jgi:hypothetical protein